MALEWANTFCSDGALLERNFSLLGPGDTCEADLLVPFTDPVSAGQASSSARGRGKGLRGQLI